MNKLRYITCVYVALSILSFVLGCYAYFTRDSAFHEIRTVPWFVYRIAGASQLDSLLNPIFKYRDHMQGDLSLGQAFLWFIVPTALTFNPLPYRLTAFKVLSFVGLVIWFFSGFLLMLPRT